MKERRVRETLMECNELMADLFQSGLSTVPQSALERLRGEELKVRQFGQEWLGDRLLELASLLEKRRHEIRRETEDQLCGLVFKIESYLEAGITKAGMDEAKVRICQREWERDEEA